MTATIAGDRITDVPDVTELFHISIYERIPPLITDAVATVLPFVVVILAGLVPSQYEPDAPFLESQRLAQLPQFEGVRDVVSGT